MIDISSLGINPGFAAIIALWITTYGAAFAWLIRRAKTEHSLPIWLWLIVIFLLPAGQFVAMLYFFRTRRRVQTAKW